MEPVTLILTALAAGASAGALDTPKDDLKEKDKAAYAHLRGLASKRVSGRPHGEMALAQYESAPQKWQSLLSAELTAAGAARNANLGTAAKEVMQLLDQAGTKHGKYIVSVRSSAGVQVGDGNVQVNHF